LYCSNVSWASFLGDTAASVSIGLDGSAVEALDAAQSLLFVHDAPREIAWRHGPRLSGYEQNVGLE